MYRQWGDSNCRAKQPRPGLPASRGQCTYVQGLTGFMARDLLKYRGAPRARIVNTSFGHGTPRLKRYPFRRACRYQVLSWVRAAVSTGEEPEICRRNEKYGGTGIDI